MGWKISGGLLLALFLLGAGTKWLYTKYDALKIEYAVQTRKLEGVKKDFKIYVKKTKATIIADGVAHTKLQQDYNDEKRKADELGKKLAKHDINYLAFRKPGLISRIFSRGTARVFRDLEKSSVEFSETRSNKASRDSTPQTKPDIVTRRKVVGLRK